MRTFIAIDFNEEIRHELFLLQHRLGRDLPHLKWTKPEQLHLTMKFLGEIEESQSAAISSLLSELAANQKSFDVRLSAIGCFGPRGAVNVVWVGLHEPTGVLNRLHEAIESAVEPLGFPRECRPFAPHLTVARNKNPRSSPEIRKVVDKEHDFAAGPQRVSSVTFYHSTPGPKGSTYRVISIHPFSK